MLILSICLQMVALYKDPQGKNVFKKTKSIIIGRLQGDFKPRFNNASRGAEVEKGGVGTETKVV